MRKGTRPAFWKKYEAMQVAMIRSCMPATAGHSGTRPMQLEASLALFTKPYPWRLTSLEPLRVTVLLH